MSTSLNIQYLRLIIKAFKVSLLYSAKNKMKSGHDQKEARIGGGGGEARPGERGCVRVACLLCEFKVEIFHLYLTRNFGTRP